MIKRLEEYNNTTSFYSKEFLNKWVEKQPYVSVRVYEDEVTSLPLFDAPFFPNTSLDLFTNFVPVLCTKKHFVENVIPNITKPFIPLNLFFINDMEPDEEYDKYFFWSKECIFDIPYDNWQEFCKTRYSKASRTQLVLREDIVVENMEDRNLLPFLDRINGIRDYYHFYNTDIYNYTAMKVNGTICGIIVWSEQFIGDVKIIDLNGIHTDNENVFCSDVVKVFINWLIESGKYKDYKINLGPRMIHVDPKRTVYKKLFEPRDGYPLFPTVYVANKVEESDKIKPPYYEKDHWVLDSEFSEEE